MVAAPVDSISGRMRAAILAALWALSPAPAAGQFNTGEIGGVVRDTSGGVLPGATVTATHVATGIVVERVTDGEGRFLLPALRIGTWNVAARLEGLVPQAQKIDLEVGRLITLQFALAVQGLSEQIEVRRTPPMLQVTTAEISDVIENREVVQLPLNGRNFLALAQLSDAVVIPPGGTRGEALQQAGPLPNVGGQRSGHNIYLLDGTKVTDELFNNLVINPSVDAIEEFKIQKSMYPAEFGGKASALINVVTRGRRQFVSRQRLRVPSRRRVRFAELLQADWRARAATEPGSVRRHTRRTAAPQPVVLLRKLRGPAHGALADANVFGADAPPCAPATSRGWRQSATRSRSPPRACVRPLPTTRSRRRASIPSRRRYCNMCPLPTASANTQNLTAVEEQDRRSQPVQPAARSSADRLGPGARPVQHLRRR